jgi:uncharacterized protein (TIGR02302 family)
MSDAPHSPEDRTPSLARGLRRKRGLMRAVLLAERLVPRLWPAAGLGGAFACLALLDLLPLLPPTLHAALLAATGMGVIVLTWRGLRGLSLPNDTEADRRLERNTGLRHRPLAVLADRPALPGAEALWRAHVARASTQVRRLRVGLPHPGLAARDRQALRGGLGVALIACAVIAGSDAPDRLARALQPGFGPQVAPPAVQVQAWITPPGYTGLAPLFLKPGLATVAVPAASHLTVSVTGAASAPALTLGGRPIDFQALDAASYQADQDLSGGGRLSVRQRGAELAGWNLSVVADAAPQVSFPEPPGVARGNSRTPSTRLPWEVHHAYGVVSLQAELHLAERQDAPALVLSVPLPGGAPKSAKGARVQDLTAHPYAGLPVIGRLVARDAPGLVGTSTDAAFTLPERRFDNPTARILIQVRKALTLHPDERLPAVHELERVARLPDVWTNDAGAWLNLQALTSLLYRDSNAEAVPETQSRLWQLALHLEEGGLERTAKELAQARRELHELLERQKTGEKIDKQELDRRMQAVQEALQRHLQALAEQLRRDPDALNDPDAQHLDARDMQRLAEQMREAAREGRMQDAEQELAQLEKMLDQLDAARPEHGAADRQRAEKRQRGQQQMSVLQDIVRREGGLLDHAQQRAPQPDARRGDRDAAPPQDAPSQRRTDRAVQQALRRALGELMQQYGDLTGQVPPNLGEADAAMRDSAQALGEARDDAASNAQQRAIEALQKGGQAMSEQLARQFGKQGGSQGEQEGEEGASLSQGDKDGGPPGGHGQRAGRQGEGRDPLGRSLQDSAAGVEDGDTTEVPEQMEQARSRAIQEELRRRGAERTRPQPELDYIDRLLRQF